jgi:cysteine desulfurase
VTLSPVLAAMRVPPEEGMGAVRFSLGRTTTWEELEGVIRMLKEAANLDDKSGKSVPSHDDA